MSATTSIILGLALCLAYSQAMEYTPFSESSPDYYQEGEEGGYEIVNEMNFPISDSIPIDSSMSDAVSNEEVRANYDDIMQEMVHSQGLTEGTPGPIGYLFHRTSGKAIHPLGGSANPRDGTRIVTYGDGGASGERLQFRFIPVQGFGHFGFIEHVASKAVIHPLGGSSNPRNNKRLVLHRSRHHGALFTFDEELERIVHIGGKFWHPLYGSFRPRNNNRVVLHGANNGAARFFLGDTQGRRISAYPVPKLFGNWTLLRVVATPKVPVTIIEKYREGMSRTKTTTREHSWSISVDATVEHFKTNFSASASAQYAGVIRHTSSSTWTTERDESIELNVPAGPTVVFWQFVYEMEQYNEGFKFKSNVIGSSNSVNVHPVLN